MTAEKNDKETLFLRRVPSEVKNHFKATCAEAGVTMQAALIYLMQQTKADDLKLLSLWGKK